MSKPVAITASFLALAVTAAGQPEEWIQLFPMGEIKPLDGRKPWRLRDKAHAEQVIATSLKLLGTRTELPIDYDHQTDFAAIKGVGGLAPAAGWMKELVAREDGIWARVEWTGPATQKLIDREYRYISPTFYDDKDRNLTAIARAALTNNPALDLPAVAASQSVDDKENDDMLKDIAVALGLPETATLEEVQAAITANQAAAQAADTALAQIRTAAGVKADADGAAIAGVITAMKDTGGGDASKLQEAVITLQTEVNTLKADTSRKEAEALVDAAVKAGKIIPAAREAFINLASKDRAQFDSIVGVQPVILASGQIERKHEVEGGDTLTGDEVNVASMLGLTAEDYAKSRKETIR